MKPIPINEKLVWDYDIPDDAQENQAFREWYVTRVLTNGAAADIRAIGFSTIHEYLPHLFLPREIREFWQWYRVQEVKILPRMIKPLELTTLHAFFLGLADDLMGSMSDPWT